LPNPYKSEANHELMISKLASLYVAPGGGDKIELLPAVISQRLKRKNARTSGRSGRSVRAFADAL